LIITIQAFVRGFILRRSHQALYGGNLVEKVAAATLIQKIYRGFRGRGLRFYEPMSMHGMWLDTRLNSEYRASRRRGIRFINTGPLPYKFAWVRSNGTFANPTLIVGKTLEGLAMSTFVSHWFAIYPHVEGEEQTGIRSCVDEEQSGVRYVRVNDAFTSNGFFDVNTGLSFSRQHWEERRSLSDGGYLLRHWPNGPAEPGISFVCECGTCQRRRQSQLDEDSDDDEVRLQLAIQLSITDIVCDNDTAYNLARIMQLSPEEMITDDAPDYDIDVMFNDTRVSPEGMITDDAPNYDIHFLWVSHI
jgi:hypothetical protein